MSAVLDACLFAWGNSKYRGAAPAAPVAIGIYSNETVISLIILKSMKYMLTTLPSLPKQLLLVIPHLRNALENIIAGQMHLPLRWNLRQQLIATPTPGRLLDRTHIDDPVMQMLHNPRIRPARKERLVGMDTIPREQGGARGRDVALDVGEEAAGGGRGGSGRGADGGGEPRAAVDVDAPGRHRVQGGVRVVDDGFEAVGLEELQLTVGDKAADLEDLVCFRVQTCHLRVV